MPKDYIPQNDVQFRVWFTNFLNTAESDLTALHLLPADTVALNTALNNFSAQLDNFQAAQTSFHSATAAKDDTRKIADDKIRQVVRRIQGYSDVPAAMKIALGINPRDGGRTHGEPVAPDTLTAYAYANGINEIYWNRNGNKPNTIFQVEALIGDATDFVNVGSTSGTRFKHIGQTPGVHIVYRVVAQRDGMESVPSTGVSVYEPAGSAGTVALKLAA